MVITCQDIYPMDLGTSGWTEFKMSEDVASYMAENIELFNCETGLAHSHHTLGAFFSSQDNLMLQQEGNDTNCFVSLVVDTPGKYVARVTRKVQTKSEVTIKNLGTSYEFFGEGSKAITKDNTEATKVIDKEVIEYFDLEVERHEVPNTLSYLDDRFEEIEKKKEFTKNNTNVRASSPNDKFKWDDIDDFRSYLHRDDNKETIGKELDLFNQEQDRLSKEDTDKLDKVMTSNWQPDAKKIHQIVASIFLLSLNINPDKVNLKQWVTNHMVKVYEKKFGKYDSRLIGGFDEWKDFIIQFTLDYFDDDIPEDIIDDTDLIQSRVAEAIYDEMGKYENNIYITVYRDTLEQYIVE